MIERTEDRNRLLVGRAPRQRGIDGLVLNRDEVWLVLGRDGDDARDLLGSPEDDGVDGPLRVCRAIVGGGRVVIGAADPLRDRLLSEMLMDEDGPGRT